MLDERLFPQLAPAPGQCPRLSLSGLSRSEATAPPPSTRATGNTERCGCTDRQETPNARTRIEIIFYYMPPAIAINIYVLAKGTSPGRGN